MLRIKEKLVNIVFLILSFLPNSCQKKTNNINEFSPRDKAHWQFLKKVDKLMVGKYDIVLSGEGCLSHLDTKTTRGTFFNLDTKNELESDNARILSVKMVLEVLKLHLEDDNYKPYLFEYPFNIKNVNISISMPINKPDRLVFWPNVKIVDFRKNHFYYRFYQRPSKGSSELKKMHGYVPPNEEIIESFRWALNQVKEDIPLDLLGVAAKLGLLDGKLEDEYRDSRTEAYEETQTKESRIELLESLNKSGYVSKDDLKRSIEEISREN